MVSVLSRCVDILGDRKRGSGQHAVEWAGRRRAANKRMELKWLDREVLKAQLHK